MRRSYQTAWLCAAAAMGWLAAPSTAAACDPRLSLSFEDAAPRDRLTLVNLSETPWLATDLQLDLAPSAGALVLDTAPGGPGTSLSGAVSGADLSAPPEVSDGATRLMLTLRDVAPGERSVVLLDLDQSGAAGFAPSVSAAALKGARAEATFRAASGRESVAKGVFGDRGAALLAPPACV
ncbi:MAG: hypothetical protein AAGM38_18105 [Pseudomonadota bacterium]